MTKRTTIVRKPVTDSTLIKRIVIDSVISISRDTQNQVTSFKSLSIFQKSNQDVWDPCHWLVESQILETFVQSLNLWIQSSLDPHWSWILQFDHPPNQSFDKIKSDQLLHQWRFLVHSSQWTWRIRLPVEPKIDSNFLKKIHYVAGVHNTVKSTFHIKLLLDNEPFLEFVWNWNFLHVQKLN